MSAERRRTAREEGANQRRKHIQLKALWACVPTGSDEGGGGLWRENGLSRWTRLARLDSKRISNRF
jgi:hypothetical protein